MPGCSFVDWPFIGKSYRGSANHYEGTSEIQKLIVTAQVLEAAAGESDAG
jgi:hypothetical protein